MKQIVGKDMVQKMMKKNKAYEEQMGQKLIQTLIYVGEKVEQRKLEEIFNSLQNKKGVSKN